MTKKAVIVKRKLDGDETFLAGATGEVEYKNAWARAIADAWENPDLKNALLNNPIDILAKHGFVAPPGLAIEVELVGGDLYDPSSKKWKEKELRSTVEMVIPPKPDDNAAFALQDYKAIGKSYPFTSIG